MGAQNERHTATPTLSRNVGTVHVTASLWMTLAVYSRGSLVRIALWQSLILSLLLILLVGPAAATLQLLNVVSIGLLLWQPSHAPHGTIGSLVPPRAKGALAWLRVLVASASLAAILPTLVYFTRR